MVNFRDRHAVVLGLGQTGLSMARWLSGKGTHVKVADTRSAPPGAARLATELPRVPLSTGPFDDATFDGVDLIAISPGVPKDQPAIAAAVARGVELVGDVELFARALPPGQRLLAVTGSNGKTTVATLTGELVRASSLTSAVIGNIGEPVLDALAEFEQTGDWPDVIVVELSSFQLETTSSLDATAAAVLNVTENHLDRYADFAAYAGAKARIFSGRGQQVLNRDDAYSIGMRLPRRSAQTFGGSAPRTDAEWGLVDRDGATWLARGQSLLVDANELALLGRHNALNALAALALAASVISIDDRVLAALAAFRGLPHRVERIAEISGVLFVNDSKGTTVAATQAALAGLGRPAVLIAGGEGKGQDFAPLKPSVDTHCRAVVLIGRDAAVIAAALAGTTASVEFAALLEIAVARAIALAHAGDVVLLSPACASFDMFRDYLDRGDRFRAAVATHALEHAHA